MDISLMINDYKFNYRVSAVVYNNNKILLHKNKNDDFYALPGGRIKIGEDSLQTLKREFHEEIGENIIVNKMIGIVENFFMYNNIKYHEVMLIYNIDFEKNSKLYNTDIIHGIEYDGNLEFIWKDLNDLKNIDLRPTNLKNTLNTKINKFIHIIDKSL